jgi:hypothetical protein
MEKRLAVIGLVTAAVWYTRLKNWGRLPGEVLANSQAWEIQRLSFPHCEREPAWGDFAFAEVFKSHSPRLVSDPGVFLPGMHN